MPRYMHAKVYDAKIPWYMYAKVYVCQGICMPRYIMQRYMYAKVYDTMVYACKGI
jgi:hypothetical protein